MTRSTSSASGARRRSSGPARIYFKDESVSPAGSHKTNTSAPLLHQTVIGLEAKEQLAMAGETRPEAGAPLGRGAQ